ncbi:Ornithine carbamoyltransferase subunit I [Buchnera aphidicola (Cinara kochiana kochiana)]|uniref:Ornithine carbamoyltransferase n=1 Tax=Buchnera aphidicola (Cinara kochiana kochiana) TaxID=2518976 RepID=A0A451D5T4_9GAMM|nr:ornithine carbamoyltransferase [Buchnera aphidicola]VFP81143.1 Ornithine carbamoyltransferase subunit I [Buchnera aphidicola (Cinara kochiana kochiana)]
MKTLYKKSCLKLSNFTCEEIFYLIQLSKFLKKHKHNKTEKKYIQGKNIALIFEKQSTRTRCAFEVAAHDQGAHTTYIGPNDTHIGYKESIEDSAKILGTMYDGIQYRGFSDTVLKDLKKYSKIPIWNGLTDKFHPTQILADLFTIIETFPKKSLKKIHCAYVGDAQNNIANSLIEAANIINFKLNIVAPKSYWPQKKLLTKNYSLNNNQKNIFYTDKIQEGVRNVDFIYTDVWVSLGESDDVWGSRIEELYPYQINKKMLNMTNNPDVKILHCLPALHNKKSLIGLKLHNKFKINNGLEITDDIFNSSINLSFQQSENRLHTIKSLLVSCLSEEKIF